MARVRTCGKTRGGVATVTPAEVLAVHEQYYDQLGKLRREGLL